MKAASAELLDILDNGHVVSDHVRVIGEWNQNRYQAVTASSPVDDYDTESFPIESIVGVDRPGQGALKAFTVPGTPIDDFTTKTGRTTGDDTDSIEPVRYYTVSADPTYTYWVSPDLSSTDLGGHYGFASAVEPQILYDEDAWTNKIVVQFDASVVVPVTYFIDVTKDGVVWETVATSPSLLDGRVELYHQGSDVWSSAVNRDNSIQIRGIRVRVTSINKQDVRLSLIEVSARIELDLSQYVIDYNLNYTMAEGSAVLPIGQASSNTGSISFFNDDGFLNNNDPSGILFKRLNRGVEIIVDHGIDTTSAGGAGVEWTRVATMSSDKWTISDAYGITVDIKDKSYILQSIDAPRMFSRNTTIGETMWTMCDMSGFNNYAYSLGTGSSNIVNEFWVDEDKTVWDVLQELSEATQTAIYFDEYGVMQLKHREAAFDHAAAASGSDYHLSTVNDTALANVVSSIKEGELETNDVSIGWTLAKYAKLGDGIPRMTSVWRPDGTVVMRCTPLIADITDASMTLRLKPSETVTWPYEGLIQIGAEIIRYKGKQYAYYDNSNARHTTWVYSNEDVRRINNEESSKYLAFKNSFTGLIKVEKRGEWNTVAKEHTVDIDWWKGFRGLPGGSMPENSNVITHNKNSSTVTVSAKGTAQTVAMARRLLNTGENTGWVGTVFQFKPNTGGAAGIVCNMSTDKSGYYIEVMTSPRAASANHTNEVNLVIRKPGGALKRLNKGFSAAIAPGVPYKLDVSIQYGTNHIVSVFLDGVYLGKFTVSGGDKVTPKENIALFARGPNTTAEFGYAYMIAESATDTYDADTSTFLDWVTGGYTNDLFWRDRMFVTRTGERFAKKTSAPAGARLAQVFFEEFGPLAHEIREFDVNFEGAPVLHSSLYMSNNKVFPISYEHTPFGARFTLVNASRQNEIISGTDENTFSDNSVDQIMMIYGNAICKEEPEYVKRKNDQSIKINGRAELEIDSPWIQTEAGATSLAEWIVQRWDSSPEDYQVVIFGNPLLQIGDVVTFTHPEAFFDQKKFFVKGITHAYSSGLSTTLSLRSA